MLSTHIVPHPLCSLFSSSTQSCLPFSASLALGTDDSLVTSSGSEWPGSPAALSSAACSFPALGSTLPLGDHTPCRCRSHTEWHPYSDLWPPGIWFLALLSKLFSPCSPAFFLNTLGFVTFLTLHLAPGFLVHITLWHPNVSLLGDGAKEEAVFSPPRFDYLCSFGNAELLSNVFPILLLCAWCHFPNLILIFPGGLPSLLPLLSTEQGMQACLPLFLCHSLQVSPASGWSRSCCRPQAVS